jgi:hypothetical protein
MTKDFDVWYRNPLEVLEGQIGNSYFANEVDYTPKQVFGQNKKSQYTDLISGQWAWDQAVSFDHSVRIRLLLFASKFAQVISTRGHRELNPEPGVGGDRSSAA